jgi:twitching motility protein PilT
VELNHILEKAMEENASDVHICVGIPPVFRINGELIHLKEKPMMPQDCIILAKQCLTQKNYESFLDVGEADVAYSLPGICRFRVNVFKQRGSCAIAFRVIPNKIPEFRTLALPNMLLDFSEKRRGLILVTGPTGSGKSTTLSSLIEQINITRKEHIITIEDPIEYTYSHKKSIINQREIGMDTQNFASALRSALREDPDVILLGEMRDQETISTALTAAETGHLVLSTLHTVGASKTIDRIIDVFHPYQQAQIRSQLSTVLIGIVSQQLMKTKEGNGRIVATEVMAMTPAISNLIREGKTPQINTCIHTGSEHGMHSMDSCLVELYRREIVDFQTAASYAVDYDNFRKLLSVG